MAIDYIKSSDGVSSVTGAQKINLYYISQIKQNPFLRHRAIPFQQEGRITGGMTYYFRSVLGIDEGQRRTGAPTSSTIDYDNYIKNTQLELTVLQPWDSKTYPVQQSDMIQLDGIDYAPIIAQEITNAGINFEIKTDYEALVNDPAILKIDGSIITDDLEQLKELKRVISNYYAINANTPDWAAATTPIKAYDYFTAQRGSYTPDRIKIHVHPAKFMAFSNAITEAGAGSELQYREFVSGVVPMIGGVEVIQNNRLDVDKVYILPLNSIGAPDPAVTTFTINSFQDQGNNLSAIRGWYYYDSKLIQPELVTEINFTAP